MISLWLPFFSTKEGIQPEISGIKGERKVGNTKSKTKFANKKRFYKKNQTLEQNKNRRFKTPNPEAFVYIFQLFYFVV